MLTRIKAYQILKVKPFITNIALFINGPTIHSLLGLSIKWDVDSNNLKVKATNHNRTYINYLIFDKISMIGFIMLANIHRKLQN
jgi:hypothetical protein